MGDDKCSDIAQRSVTLRRSLDQRNRLVRQKVTQSCSVNGSLSHERGYKAPEVGRGACLESNVM